MRTVKIAKVILSIATILALLVLFGCTKAVAREDTIKSTTETAAETTAAAETTQATVAADWWKAPASGQIKSDDLPEPDKNAGPFVIAFANNDTVLEFCVDVWKGVEEAAKQYPNIKVSLFDCGNSADSSLKAVLDIQTLNPDLVAYFNWVGAGQEMAKWCTENKKPEIEVDVPYNTDAWFYGVNNPMTGQLGGEKMGEWVKANWPGEDVWIIQNTEYQSGEDVYLRNSEFLRVFQETVGDSVKIVNLKADGKVDELNGDTDPQLCVQLFSEWLTANPKADHMVIWSLNDEGASGFYAAAKNQNRLENCIFGGIGGTSYAFNIALADKRFLGSVGVFPELYGVGVLKAAMLILTGHSQEVPKTIVTKYDWITLDNLKQYYPKYYE